MELRLHQRLQDHLHDRLRHAIGHSGDAERALPPLSFGISTSRTGGGKYEPDDIRFQTL